MHVVSVLPISHLLVVFVTIFFCLCKSVILLFSLNLPTPLILSSLCWQFWSYTVLSGSCLLFCCLNKASPFLSFKEILPSAHLSNLHFNYASLLLPTFLFHIHNFVVPLTSWLCLCHRIRLLPHFILLPWISVSPVLSASSRMLNNIFQKITTS